MSQKIIIVGAGPAGLFAALELTKDADHPEVTIIEQGPSLGSRPRTETMIGVGGSGTFSDGKLHFTPVLSHEKLFDLYSLEEYQTFLDYSEKLFLDYGVTAPNTPENLAEADEIVEQCHQQGIKLYIRRCRHVGSDMLPGVVKNMVDELEKRGVKFICQTKIDQIIAKDKKIISIKSGNQNFTADSFLIAPGRIGAIWFQNQAKILGLNYKYQEVEIGVRVEFPATVMEKHSKIMHENIYSIQTPTFGDTVRTFCPCPNGFVAIENYQDFLCVNGHSNANTFSSNSNFNFTVPVTLTEPTGNTSVYAANIAKLTNLLGDNKPLLQRLGDLKSGHRSTWEKINNNLFKPTLTNVTPGDISLALPHRLVTDIIEGLDILNRVLPGINSDSTLLYAPEVKLRGNRVTINRQLQTEIPNLFVAGDGVGASGNIVGAAISGIMAARGMLV